MAVGGDLPDLAGAVGEIISHLKSFQLLFLPPPHHPEPSYANAAMVKNQRSSASSATRKKHAKKAAIASGEVVENPPVPKQKKPRGKEKARLKTEPKKKVYIPPVRPQAIQPDPLDTLGIAYSISSELLVILRRLGKKDVVTKIRALEELQSDWVIRVKETKDPQPLEEITAILPVWVCLPASGIPLLFSSYHRSITSPVCSYITPEESGFYPAGCTGCFWPYRGSRVNCLP